MYSNTGSWQLSRQEDHESDEEADLFWLRSRLGLPSAEGDSGALCSANTSELDDQL